MAESREVSPQPAQKVSKWTALKQKLFGKKPSIETTSNEQGDIKVEDFDPIVTPEPVISDPSYTIIPPTRVDDTPSATMAPTSLDTHVITPADLDKAQSPTISITPADLHPEEELLQEEGEKAEAIKVEIPLIADSAVLEVIKRFEGGASGDVTLVRLRGRTDPVIRKSPKSDSEIEPNRNLRSRANLEVERAATVRAMERRVKSIAGLVGVGPGPILYKEFVPTFQPLNQFDMMTPPPLDGSVIPTSQIGRPQLAFALANTVAELHAADIGVGDDVTIRTEDVIPTIETRPDGSWQFLTKLVDLGNNIGKQHSAFTQTLGLDTDYFFALIADYGLGLPSFPTKTEYTPFSIGVSKYVGELRREWFEKVNKLNLHPSLRKVCEEFGLNTPDRPNNGVELLDHLKPFFQAIGLTDEVIGSGQPK